MEKNTSTKGKIYHIKGKPAFSRREKKKKAEEKGLEKKEERKKRKDLNFMRKGRKKRLYGLRAAALVAVITAAPVASVMPAYATTVTPINTTVNGTATTFDKYLVMKKNASVPTATFKYTVSIPSDDEMKSLANPEDTNETNLTVRKGIGSPTVSDTAFKPGDQTFIKRSFRRDLINNTK